MLENLRLLSFLVRPVISSIVIILRSTYKHDRIPGVNLSRHHQLN